MTLRTAFIVAAALGLSAGAAVAQDVAAGEQVFKKTCSTCHRVGPGAKNAVGPTLNGVIDRKTGTIAGFNYSKLNRAAGENGLVWTEKNIFEYLPDPKAYLTKYLVSKGKQDLATGNTNMTFKLESEKDRKDVIAYLKSHKDSK